MGTTGPWPNAWGAPHPPPAIGQLAAYRHSGRENSRSGNQNIADFVGRVQTRAVQESEPPVWTFEDHMFAGTRAIAQIEAEYGNFYPELICHHFSEVSPVDPVKVSIEATYNHLLTAFRTLGLDFLPDRLEAWETTIPDLNWLAARIPGVIRAATSSSLIYQGWTWEPLNRQPIGATDIQVVNNLCP